MNFSRIYRFLTLGLVVTLVAACATTSEPTTTLAPSTSAPSTTTPPTQPTTTLGEEPTTTTLPEAPPFEVQVIATGDQHACAIGIDSFTYCWGYDRQGQLGNGTNEDRNVPTLVQTDQTFVSLTAGRYFTCALNGEGAAFCWGDNSWGQLGNGADGGGGPDANSPIPVMVDTELRFTDLASGQSHVCGLTDDGATYCWGAGPSGQLGTGSTHGAQTSPVRAAAGIEVTSLATGSHSNMCAIDTDANAWCWGSNSHGQLGTGDKYNNSQPNPQAVSGGLAFSSLSHGHAFVCGVETEGGISCWGSNTEGQLGDGTQDERLAPNPVPDSAALSLVAAGGRHTCALDPAGAAFCWGNNAFGQLGNDTFGGQEPSAVPVSGGLSFTSLSLGEEFSCGITTDSVAYCWGSNRNGWLGDGTRDPRLVPTRVAPPSAG